MKCYRKINTTGFHLYEVAIVVKFMESKKWNDDCQRLQRGGNKKLDLLLDPWYIFSLKSDNLTLEYFL